MSKKYLKIGEIIITDKKETIITDLGSCISFVIFEPISKICAISHCQLPYDFYAKNDCRESCPRLCNRHFDKSNNYRYISCSFNYLMTFFEKKGIRKENLQVSLFGGANVIKEFKNPIGTRNIEYARNLIISNKMRIKNEITGGNTGMRITVDTESGNTTVEEI